MRRWLGRARTGDADEETDVNGAHEGGRGRDFDVHLETGFQLATFQGPLCAEPMEGLAYFVESLDVDREGIEREQGEP